MTVQLDHALIPARDRKATAKLLATYFGVNLTGMFGQF